MHTKSENPKKLLELIAENCALAEQISAKKDPKDLIAKAAERDIELTGADFEQPSRNCPMTSWTPLPVAAI